MEINIAYLCTYFSSSSSQKKSRNLTGKPNDHSRRHDRISVHTEKELYPFLCIVLPKAIPVRSVEVRSQGNGENGECLVVEVEADNKWRAVQNEKARNATPNNRFELSTITKKIRISRLGYNDLSLSSVEILSPLEDVVTYLKEQSSQRVCFADGHFYGLGGRLAVYASALGYIGNSQTIKAIFCDESARGLVQVPLPTKLSGKGNELKWNIEQHAPRCIANALVGGGQYKAETSQTLHRPPTSEASETPYFKYVSRNNVKGFAYESESAVEVRQRLYSRIVPADEVLDMRNEIINEKDLGVRFSRALGVHIRHGNGERYYSKRKKKWGVKAPKVADIETGIKAALEHGRDKIDTIVFASDCSAIENAIRGIVGTGLKIVSIADFVQPPGSGSGHNEEMFDENAPRINIDKDFEARRAFAEILVLSRCAVLSGAHSNFFEAVIGFSECGEGDIFNIKNTDRYIELDDDMAPLATSSEPWADYVRNKLKKCDVKIDGVFVKEGSEVAHLAYFDDDLYVSPNKLELTDSVIGNIHRELKALRFY